MDSEVPHEPTKMQSAKKRKHKKRSIAIGAGNKTRSSPLAEEKEKFESQKAKKLKKQGGGN